jgi:hypothetical protein
MRASRPVPVVGMHALVLHLAATEPAVVEQVLDDGRRVVVMTENGERIEFSLRQATAQFHSSVGGPRLKLLPE